MALIDCPECGGQVSDRAPTCPHCGVPIVAASTAYAAPQADPQLAPAQGSLTDPQSATYTRADLNDYETVEPFKLRIAGRPIPIAALLFWGGMVFGVIVKYALPPAADAEPELWRRLPWAMIWLGVLWFAVTEFGALIKNKLKKR
ncbi:MAG: zinc ribbon domain-containing protein [Lamprobacter sp.]|uniref:zinc ribbon domain-containing protein n=1 Tax=Lamprobacter sp. TaxID=3100796 RepID=UPI002B2625BA|nr:zinc ribbon domain-containing protein [Lamprobacter sp.]MEA3639048.1 zinc ribbon domain-containing protein [Lamprobacter sp.]